MQKTQLALLVALGAVPFGPAAHAQNILSAYSQAGTATAGTTSVDYRYTRHTGSGSGRGGRSFTYYRWDQHTDQTTTQSVPLPLGGAAQVTSQGTFYGPACAATAGGSAALLTNTPARAVLSVRYTATTTVPASLGAHQGVTVTAQPGGTFTFTVDREANVQVTTTGDPGGVFRLSGTGVQMGPLSGTSGPYALDTPLTPGTYLVTSSLTDTASRDTQTGTSLNPGTASTAWGFTLTITPTEAGGAAGGGGGDTGGGGD